MTLTLTGTVENLEDVEALKRIIYLFQEAQTDQMNSLYWSAYPILIAWENHVSGSFELSESGKAESLAEMVEAVNYILSRGLKYPRDEEEGTDFTPSYELEEAVDGKLRKFTIKEP